jgi:hypothetical protein
MKEWRSEVVPYRQQRYRRVDSQAKSKQKKARVELGAGRSIQLGDKSIATSGVGFLQRFLVGKSLEVVAPAT